MQAKSCSLAGAWRGWADVSPNEVLFCWRLPSLSTGDRRLSCPPRGRAVRFDGYQRAFGGALQPLEPSNLTGAARARPLLRRLSFRQQRDQPRPLLSRQRRECRCGPFDRWRLTASRRQGRQPGRPVRAAWWRSGSDLFDDPVLPGQNRAPAAVRAIVQRIVIPGHGRHARRRVAQHIRGLGGCKNPLLRPQGRQCAAKLVQCRRARVARWERPCKRLANGTIGDVTAAFLPDAAQPRYRQQQGRIARLFGKPQDI
jgi:hypothetical protein